MTGDSFAKRYRRSDSGGFFKAMIAIFRILDPPPPAAAAAAASMFSGKACSFH
ncbi:hypothetical protein DY000_02050099 [Brassica cretica]|uniref:CASP-like protein n=1 Tax=Brassica cretica TaxID=69181 RepID=A0ABQ7F1C0_BRACR|nr:hypothetical protein DY000_02050099 [Brassica cretica]